MKTTTIIWTATFLFATAAVADDSHHLELKHGTIGTRQIPDMSRSICEELGGHYDEQSGECEATITCKTLGFQRDEETGRCIDEFFCEESGLEYDEASGECFEEAITSLDGLSLTNIDGSCRGCHGNTDLFNDKPLNHYLRGSHVEH